MSHIPEYGANPTPNSDISPLAQYGASSAPNSSMSDGDHEAKETSPNFRVRGGCSLDKIVPLSAEHKSHLARRTELVRIIVCLPQPKLSDPDSKSKVTHLHLGNCSTPTTIDVEAVPIHNASIAIIFRHRSSPRTIFARLDSFEVIADGNRRCAQIREVKAVEDFETTNWCLSAESMTFIQIKTLLQRFFSDRTSLPIDILCSDQFHVLSDGGLFIDYDHLPLSLKKYDSEYFISNKRVIGAQPATSCRICNLPAVETNSNGFIKEELEILQKYGIRDSVQISSCRSTFPNLFFFTDMAQFGGSSFSVLVSIPGDSVEYFSPSRSSTTFSRIEPARDILSNLMPYPFSDLDLFCSETRRKINFKVIGELTAGEFDETRPFNMTRQYFTVFQGRLLWPLAASIKAFDAIGVVVRLLFFRCDLLLFDGLVLENGKLTSQEAVTTDRLPSNSKNTQQIDDLQHPVAVSVSSTRCQAFQNSHHAESDSVSLPMDHESSIEASTRGKSLLISNSQRRHATDNPKPPKKRGVGSK
ncbi:hypothetical protein MMC29_000158 [Sticta canariensis]|nr:hypothetical protein [Sticta canariensis]